MQVVLVSVTDNRDCNDLQAAMNIGNAPGPNATAAGPPHQSSTMPSSSHAARIIPPASTPFQPAPSLPTFSTPLIPNESSVSSNHTTNLVKPSLFAPPPSSSVLPPIASSIPTAPPLQPPVTIQRPYGTPLLQPFPPPAPSPSLTPTPASNYGPVITRDKVRDVLLRLVQVLSTV